MVLVEGVMIELELVILYAAITILSLILLIVTFVSYRSVRNRKLVFVSGIFFFLFIRGIVLSLTVFFDVFNDVVSSGYLWVVDLVVLLLLYITYSVKS